MSVEEASERRNVGQRGGSAREINLFFTEKSINRIGDFKSYFCYRGTESKEEVKDKMTLAYDFFGLVYDLNGENYTRDKKLFYARRSFVIEMLNKQRCSICLTTRLEVEQPNMFLLPDCSHLICSSCKDRSLEVSTEFKI